MSSAPLRLVPGQPVTFSPQPMDNPMHILWVNSRKNPKTGPVLSAWVGTDLAESRASCKGCKLLGNGCYAQEGQPGHVAFPNILKTYRADPGRYTLAAGLKARNKSTRMVRLSALGDAGRVGKEAADDIADTVRAEGLALVGYTHHWREPAVAESWRGRLMASCDTLADVDAARAAGWRASVVTAPDAPRVSYTPGGSKVVQCPATLPGVKLTCDACRLCDASKPGPVVGFPAHGPSKRHAARVASGLEPTYVTDDAAIEGAREKAWARWQARRMEEGVE